MSRLIKIPAEWTGTRGQGVVVGVCDTFCDVDHPDLHGMVLEYITSSRPPRGLDMRGHCTHIASTILAVAPAARLVVYEVARGEKGSVSSLDRALGMLLQRDIDVLNLSLAYGAFHPGVDEKLSALDEKGVLIFAPAGRKPLVYPSSHPKVIVVGGKEENCGFLSAPAKFVAALPDGKHGQMSGRSVACAYASGVAALYRSCNRQADREQFLRDMKKLASKGWSGPKYRVS